MPNRNFRELLEAQWSRGNFVCVGLDSELSKIPKVAQRGYTKSMSSTTNTLVEFNQFIVEATRDLVCAYKPNIAFYEAYGNEGIIALKLTIEKIHAIAPEVPVILDAKRADIGNTNAGYVAAAFDFLGADAITVHPYLGAEALQPFLDRKDKGIIVLCRTSNPGAGEFQDLPVPITFEEAKYFDSVHAPYAAYVHVGCRTSLYNYVAYQVSKHWNKNGNCAVVVGATCPHELSSVRSIVGDMPILIPGVGAQGGDVEKTVSAGKDSRGQGMIINSSRGIIFASKEAGFAEAARRETQKLHDTINQYR